MKKTFMTAMLFCSMLTLAGCFKGCKKEENAPSVEGKHSETKKEATDSKVTGEASSDKMNAASEGTVNDNSVQTSWKDRGSDMMSLNESGSLDKGEEGSKLI